MICKILREMFFFKPYVTQYSHPYMLFSNVYTRLEANMEIFWEVGGKVYNHHQQQHYRILSITKSVANFTIDIISNVFFSCMLTIHIPFVKAEINFTGFKEI